MAKKKRAPREPRTGPARSVFELAREHRLEPIAATDVVPGRPSLVELAWDGHRVLACAMGRETRLVSADHREWNDTFPTVAKALVGLGRRDVVIEGFLCALGPSGAPSFDLLRRHVEEKAQRIVFACIDLHRLDGDDLRPAPLEERRRRLAELVAGAGDFVFSDALEGPLEMVLEGVRRLGVRGVLVRDGEARLALSATGEPIAIDRSLSAAPRITNREKLMFPRDGLSKTDVVAYYEDLAPVLLPYLKDRPVVGQRWPDSIDGFTWFQHRMPPRAPDYLRAVWIEGNRRIVVESAHALAWLANQAVLTVHGWASRSTSLAHPDWVIVDLDPGEGTAWTDVIDVAVALRKLLELLELPSVPKTSGQKGLHVLVPIGPGHGVAEVNDLARRLGLMLERALPSRVTTDPSPASRRGVVFVDTLQSYVGKMLVMPYSLRATDGAPVSTPLDWDEVGPTLDPRRFTLRTIRQRLDQRGDPGAALLRGTVSLAPALARLTV